MTSVFEDIGRMLQNGGLQITRVKSTLFQIFDESRKIQNPVREYRKEAGFLCMEMKKDQKEGHQ
jgi:hypothetical protein